MCIGRNYADHIAELNSATPKQPFFFLKPASSILLPGAGPVLKPKGVNLHYEVELALVIGKTLKDLRENDEQGAFDAISGMLRYVLIKFVRIRWAWGHGGERATKVRTWGRRCGTYEGT